MTITYTFKRKPYAHQKDALLKLIKNGWGGALLMEPRTGKTQVCIDYASILHQAGKVNRVLIVCPVSVMSVWEDEIHSCCPHRRRVLTWDRKARRTQVLPGYGQDVLDFVIVNYDAFSTPGRIIGRDEGGAVKRSKSRGGRYDLIRRLKNWQPQLIVLDESHRIKTSGARKSYAVKTLGKYAEFRVIATGTAVTKRHRVFDLYSQWKFLNPEGWIKDYDLALFKEDFGVWKSRTTSSGYSYSQFLRNRNTLKIRKLIHPDSFSVTRDECFDLPPQRTQRHLVELEGETARIYDEMAEEMIAKVKEGEYTEAQIKLVQILRLAQITSGVCRITDDTGGKGPLVRVGREKIILLEDRLDDLWEADEKVVVAARFRSDIAAAVAYGKKRKVKTYELHGGITRNQRTANIRNFRNLEGPGLFVMQPQAGSLGIDLSTSATMIWMSLTNSYVDWTQSIDRIALAPRGTVIEYILARGTIDELMYTALLEDRSISRMIVESPDKLSRDYKSVGSKRKKVLRERT